MLIKTRQFGNVEIDEKKIVHFPHGMVAFERRKKFVVLDGGYEDLPFCWLQAVDSPETAFVVVNPFLVRKDYDFELSPDDMEDIGLENSEGLAVYVVMVVPENIKKMSVNLLSPVIVNTKTMKGKQVILIDKRYSTKHLVLEEMQRSGREV